MRGVSQEAHAPHTSRRQCSGHRRSIPAPAVHHHRGGHHHGSIQRPQGAPARHHGARRPQRQQRQRRPSPSSASAPSEPSSSHASSSQPQQQPQQQPLQLTRPERHHRQGTEPVPPRPARPPVGARPEAPRPALAGPGHSRRQPSPPSAPPQGDPPHGKAVGPRGRLVAPEEDDAPIVEHAPGLTLREVVTRFWPRLRPLRRWLILRRRAARRGTGDRGRRDPAVPAPRRRRARAGRVAAPWSGWRVIYLEPEPAERGPLRLRRLPRDLDLPEVPARPARRRLPPRAVAAPARPRATPPRRRRCRG